MSISINRKSRRDPLRKQIQKLALHGIIAKQFAWRITGIWIWVYSLAAVFGQRRHLINWENSLFANLNNNLMVFGFTPSSLITFTICVKLLWLVAICAFSWVQIVGFFIYIPFLPIVLIRSIFFRKRFSYRQTRAESFKKARKDGAIFPNRSWMFPLLFLLLLWQSLYGQSSATYPLLFAMLLIALLFCSMVGRALTFALPAGNVQWNRVEAMIKASRKFIFSHIENFKTGKIQEMWQLNLAVWTSSLFLRLLRRISRWHYGKRARRRAALVVLLKFMFNLAALGGLSILFWAYAIKYTMAPSHLSLIDALLASASHAIPGIPDPLNVRVPSTVQVLSSLSAWMIFVLYAGPVASLFPSFQEQAISQIGTRFVRIRKARKAMYGFTEILHAVQTLFIENPELEKFAKLVILLRRQEDLKSFLLDQPNYVRSLAERPAEADLLRKLGIPVPDLQEFMRELGAQPIPDVPKCVKAPLI